MADQLTYKTLWILLVVLIGVYILNSITQKEGFGYYQNFFPPNPCDKKKKKQLIPIASKQRSGVLFEFPKGTPKEIMVSQVGAMFKKKASFAFTNVIDVQVEHIGTGNSDYENPTFISESYERVWIILDVVNTRPSRISIPSVSHRLKIPLKFTDKGIIAEIDRTDAAPPIDNFLHYFFDHFYCKGRYETKLKAVGKDDSNYDFVVPPDSPLDCLWENNNPNIKTCKKHPEIARFARPLSIEPDSDSHKRDYLTPAQDIDECKVKEDYFKLWDARGVPIENVQKNIKMDQYLPHPALYENKLNGLYDDVFGMSRFIPSFPTGRTTVGR